MPQERDWSFITSRSAWLKRVHCRWEQCVTAPMEPIKIRSGLEAVFAKKQKLVEFMSLLCTVKIAKSRFSLFFAIFSLKSNQRARYDSDFGKLFFRDVTSLLKASEKNSVDFGKHFFHAYLCYMWLQLDIRKK